MNAKNLHKATLILADIHELDKQITALDKKAMGIADGDKHINIELTFEQDAPVKEAAEIGEEDYLVTLRYIFANGSPKSTAPTRKESNKVKLTDNECLFVIGALIQCKKEYRRLLCAKIVELGVNL